MTYKEKCVDLYAKHLREHFHQSQDQTVIQSRAEQLFSSESMAHLNGLEHAKEVNDFVTQLLLTIAKEVAAKRLEPTINSIVLDVQYLIDSILTEDEAKSVYEFASCDIGKKIIRNLDLFKDSFFKGSLPMTTEIVARWCQPETQEAIRDYVIKLEDSDDLQ